MFPPPLPTLLRVAQDADRDVANQGAGAVAFLVFGHDNQWVALAEGEGDVTGGHREHALQIQLLERVDAVLDAFGREFRERLVDGHQAQ